MAGDTKSAGLASPASQLEPLPPVGAIDDEAIELPSWRKWVILFVVCWMPLPMTFWSTAIMPATNEIASGFGVSITSINTANAGVFVAMALSGLIWLPISTIIGRRTTYLVANVVLCSCSIGASLSPNLACFAVLWFIGGTTGPFFLVAGQTILADIFEPVTPLVGSVIATFTSWRVIYAVEAGMSMVGLILAYFFVPRASEIGNPKTIETPPQTKKEIIGVFNPMVVFCQFTYPRILLANIACGLLSFNQYGLLSSVRRIINPRFGLSSPLESGLFYLAPGAGFLIGSTLGGKLSDQIVKVYIRKRNGLRLPEDRLNSSLPAILVVLPFASFIQGVGLMASFSALNTYAAEARPAHRTAVISGKYVIQYSFAAGSVGGVVPMIDGIGVGWAVTISAVAAFIAGIMVFLIARMSKNWKH
ncbi:major facilitator superfamily domain-containing protein [Ilyonectria sp. MPI-CAGE-AT-0026]|nr:major facilitator superfamily domain-containing protein [Ilyonectria sp. MPI-CAGE-AT-0026]